MGRKAQSRTGLEIEKMLFLIFQWYFFMVKVKKKKKAKIKGNKLIYTYIHRLYIQIHLYKY